MAKLVKMIGKVCWIAWDDPVERQITRAILTGGNIIKIGYMNGKDEYSIDLTSQTGHYFEGSSLAEDGIMCRVSGTLYKSENSYFIFGVWNEQEVRNHWWSELTCVDSFSDEKPK